MAMSQKYILGKKASSQTDGRKKKSIKDFEYTISASVAVLFLYFSLGIHRWSLLESG